MSEPPPSQAAEVPRTPYAGQILTHLNQDHIDRLTQVYQDIGVAGWLEQNPLSSLELTEQVSNDEMLVNGMYFYRTRVMQAATRRSKNEFGQRFEWQKVYSVSSTAEIPFQAVQITLVHELGHHIHNILGQVDPNQFAATMSAVFFRGGTNYARLNHLEYFAESFALYTYYPTELLVRDPDGYGMIETAMSRVGLEVTQQ